MSIFDHVTNHVIKGEKTLHACKDLNSAERFSTLCVVERRKAFWFWKQPVMIPTFVTLKDLLLDADAKFSAKEKEFTLVKNVEDTTKRNMAGNVKVDAKIAKKIAADVNVSLGGEDKMDLDISLGDIIKCEVSFETIREELMDLRADASHPLLVETVLKSPKSSLCVILGTLSTKTDGKVKKEDDVKVNSEIGANVVKINVTAKGSVESTCARSYEIPSGTVLAYECHELDVRENGVINVHAVADKFERSAGIIELPLPEKPFNKMKDELEALVRWKNVVRVQEEIRSLLEEGSEKDFRVLHILLYYACLKGSDKKSMKVSNLHYLLGAKATPTKQEQQEQQEQQKQQQEQQKQQQEQQKQQQEQQKQQQEELKQQQEEQEQHWKKLVFLLGFTIDSYYGEPYVVYPSTESMDEGILRSTLKLTDSILDCFSGNWHKVPKLSRQHTHFLMKIIENYFEGKPNSLHQGKLKGLKDDSNSMDLLRGCGFKESPGGDLIYTGRHQRHLLDIYVVVYMLTVGTSCHCSIV